MNYSLLRIFFKPLKKNLIENNQYVINNIKARKPASKSKIALVLEKKIATPLTLITSKKILIDKLTTKPSMNIKANGYAKFSKYSFGFFKYELSVLFKTNCVENRDMGITEIKKKE